MLDPKEAEGAVAGPWALVHAPTENGAFNHCSLICKSDGYVAYTECPRGWLNQTLRGLVRKAGEKM